MDRSSGRGAGDAGPGGGVLRRIKAGNASPLTLGGTTTYIVGRRRVAIIDPGPALAPHVDRLAAAVRDCEAVTILLTHTHPDHAGGAPSLGDRLGAPVRGAAAGSLSDGDAIATDAGELVALATPGHAPDHIAFHWPATAAVFCGDLMLGGQDTTLVAPPEGDLADYLDSLERVAALRPRVIHPTHGPDFHDPAPAIRRYVQHRELRERQVLEALAAGPAMPEALVDRIYGPDLDPGLRRVAEGATVAYLEHLAAGGRVTRDGKTWMKTGR